MNNKIFILVAAVLIGVAFIANAPVKFSSSGEAQMSEFPKIIGNWTGVDLPLLERDYEILETRNLIIRDYTNSQTGVKVNLYIIYSSDNRRSLHPPEVCYTGGGGTILAKGIIPISTSFKVNKFIMDNKDFQQLVVYWFKSGNLTTYNYLRQQIKIVADSMLRKKTAGAMIRISAIMQKGAYDKALDSIKSFSLEIAAAVNKYVP